MDMSDAEKRTKDFYDEHAKEWGSRHMEPFWTDEMREFQGLLPTGKVVEIGVGSGRDAAALIKVGYGYVGTDASREMLAVAASRNPGAVFINNPVERLRFPRDYFDGFWASAVLLHIPKGRVARALLSIRRVVRPGGIGFIAMKEGSGEKVDQETGRFYAFYSQVEFAEILRRCGFEVVKEGLRAAGETMWLVYYVKKGKL